MNIYPDWEVYICKDEEKNSCKYFNANGYDNTGSIDHFLNRNKFSIRYLLVQPVNHQKMNQFYGHKEYNEHENIFPDDELYPASGYVILYKNKNYRDCIPKSCTANSQQFSMRIAVLG